MLTPPTSPRYPANAANASDALDAFATGDLVEVFTDSVRALARVRESHAGRLHIAFEMGEYLPWVDAAVLVRHATHARGGDVVLRACSARILHAGTSTALLQIVGGMEEVSSSSEELPPGRGPFDTLRLLDD